MTRRIGAALPPAMVERLAQGDLPARLGVGLPLVTLDREGRPHPMLLSYLEVRAYDPTSVGIVIQAGSSSARNLRERETGTLVIVEPDLIAYVKLAHVEGPLPIEDQPRLVYFLLEVKEVLEDAAADWEEGMGITEAIRYAPVPTLAEPWARATLAALAAPRARA